MAGCTWIIGASYGIGEALASNLARRGRTVIASARSSDKLDALAATAAGRIRAYPLDVTDLHAVHETARRIEDEVGTIETAVLNAGTHKPVNARDFRAAELRDLCELNLFGVANALEAIMPRMIDRRRGRIAVVSSLAGYRGLPTSAYYGATKAALINMTESLKFDLDKAGVAIQIVNPGFVRTPLTDKNEFEMPFLVEPEDAAKVIADGLETSRFEIRFPWAFAKSLAALRCLPYGLYFRAVARGTAK